LVRNANNYKPGNSIYTYENGIYEDADFHGKLAIKWKVKHQ